MRRKLRASESGWTLLLEEPVLELVGFDPQQDIEITTDGSRLVLSQPRARSHESQMLPAISPAQPDLTQHTPLASLLDDIDMSPRMRKLYVDFLPMPRPTDRPAENINAHQGLAALVVDVLRTARYPMSTSELDVEMLKRHPAYGSKKLYMRMWTSGILVRDSRKRYLLDPRWLEANFPEDLTAP